jgi:putative glycosyltransferase (TIGR04348 family)
MLRDRCRVIVQTRWDGTPADALIALHARRSAESIAHFSADAPDRAIAVMLTGTDLYRDLPTSAEAQASLDHADRIVVLQEDAPNLLAPRWRAKAEVIYQSARHLAAGAKARGRLECVALGHLREEKDPATLFRAVELLPASLPISVRHIGAALDESLGAQARALQQRESRYRYLGALPHGLARCALKAAHLLVHPSRMEGGANAIVEAVTCGTPVLASRVSGNVGMLGADYAGYFEAGDAHDLAARLVRCLEDPGYVGALAAQCRRRQALFRPEAEARAVRRLVDSLVA